MPVKDDAERKNAKGKEVNTINFKKMINVEIKVTFKLVLHDAKFPAE
jgi:hypothetical protein